MSFRKSVMNSSKHFAALPHVSHPRSLFNRSSGLKTTFDSGYLVPIFTEEVLPGDTASLDCSLFARMTTPIVPVMDNMYLETHFFYVPSRLLWDNWTRFCGEQLNPGDSTDFLIPQIASGDGFSVGSMADYYGIPTDVKGISVNALPFRAYNLIWNEWYRDENLQKRIPINKGDGPDKVADYNLMRRGKRHDYFTSCLPFPQKGPNVSIPLANFAPVSSNGKFPTFDYGSQKNIEMNRFYQGGNAGDRTLQLFNGTDSAAVKFGNESGLHADLRSASSVTINALRQAAALQQYFEVDARGGTRYTEKNFAHFGVHSPDSRLQRPEFLGGSSTRINTVPVQQTSSTDTKSPQGNLAAFGVAQNSSRTFRRSFTEHGWIIGLVNVRADLTYQQGIPREFSRRTMADFYWPTFAHLGEQPVLNKEIFATGTATDNEVFGYQERYAEYRYKLSQITGKFRSTVKGGSLDVWHLSQNFKDLPKLNDSFIQDNPPVKRVIAVQNEPEFLLDCSHNLKVARVMPVYSVPGLRKL